MKHYNGIEEVYDELKRGGEIEFLYKNKGYSITHVNGKVCFGEYNNYDTVIFYDNYMDVADYLISGKRFEDILCDIEVVFSCFD